MPGNGHGLDLDEKVPRRLRQHGNNRDVFAMVKQRMADDRLCQPPILVYPESFLGSTENFFRRINVTNQFLTPSLEEARCNELLELAQNISQDFPHLSRGAAYLKSLTDPNRQFEQCKPLRFVQSGPTALNRGLGDLELGQRPPTQATQAESGIPSPPTKVICLLGIRGELHKGKRRQK